MLYKKGNSTNLRTRVDLKKREHGPNPHGRRGTETCAHCRRRNSKVITRLHIRIAHKSANLEINGCRVNFVKNVTSKNPASNSLHRKLSLGSELFAHFPGSQTQLSPLKTSYYCNRLISPGQVVPGLEPSCDK